jgi:transglutaminase-like putative cysteine protease
MDTIDLNRYLVPSSIIDCDHSDVARTAKKLAKSSRNIGETAMVCFEFVRDNIFHSFDYRMNPVTLKASDVLAHGTGYCFAKSHLLAALLRANDIPAGLCYQRLFLEESGTYCIHGFNAVYLPGAGWYRADARGNKEGVDAQFTPPAERLAYRADKNGEMTLPGIWDEPLPAVVDVLSKFDNYLDVRKNLPDIDPVKTPAP